MKTGLLVLCLSFMSWKPCFAQQEQKDSIVHNSDIKQSESEVYDKLRLIVDLLNNDVIPALKISGDNVTGDCKNTIDSLQSILLVANKNESELKAELARENKINSDLIENYKLIQVECQNMIEGLKTQGLNISPDLLGSIENTANILIELGYPAGNSSLIREFKSRFFAVSSTNEFIEGKLISLNSIDAEIENLNNAFSVKSDFKELEKERENFADILSVYKELACELKLKIEEVRILEYPGHTSLLELQARLDNYSLIAMFPYLMDCIESFSDNPSKNPLAAVKGVCQ